MGGGASVQSTTSSRGVLISGSNAGYTKFRGSVKSTGYPLYSPVAPSLPLPCITVCHHISNAVYFPATHNVVQLFLTKSRLLLLLTPLNLTPSHMPKESKPEALWGGNPSNPQISAPFLVHCS